MSDYQRIVSYLYEYHHGIKGSNVGFAKIEKRQNRLRVYFHVKTNDQALEYKIYFYYFHQGAMNGIYLDTVKRTDAIIEFKNTYPLINDFDKMDGFLLYYSNDHFFGSQWKDHPILYEVLYLRSLLKIKMRIRKTWYLQNLRLKPKHFLKLKLLLHPVSQNTLKPFN